MDGLSLAAGALLFEVKTVGGPALPVFCFTELHEGRLKQRIVQESKINALRGVSHCTVRQLVRSAHE